MVFIPYTPNGGTLFFVVALLLVMDGAVGSCVTAECLAAERTFGSSDSFERKSLHVSRPLRCLDVCCEIMWNL
ncbi:hypothetical protein Y032_0042g696 [Ancylostoma ceylanicum]|uniref:Secreted protein n=1 Tax=Ancylostoma ceylanicum TaxID=53326 RepID=A0A016UG12_9BILA|nr:hypothetical protein Y032_0042g696 [Ancylostoma ceylanicum]